MKKGILNAWPSVYLSPEGQWISKVTLESTALPDSIQVERLGDNLRAYRLVFHGLELIMAEDTISVLDGLIHSVKIQFRPGQSQVVIDIYLELPLETSPAGKHGNTGPGLLGHNSEVSIDQTPGLPASIVCSVSRKPLQDLFKGARIGIDPGHGGKNKGHRGPVDLTEKYVALEIARELCPMLELSHAVPILTRTDDIYLTDEQRYRILEPASPILGVQIHASGDTDPLAQKYRIAAKENCTESHNLADIAAGALLERMGMLVESVEHLSSPVNWQFPIIRIEPLCLTYFADEANFRAPLFRKRIAQSIYNGIARFLAKQQDA